MKKTLHFCLILTAALFLAGCQGKFEPVESTIFITSKGTVKSAVMESFDKEYYDFQELSEDVEKEVKSYCLDVNEEVVTVESLTKENGGVSLMIDYQTVDDYASFNNVLLFHGTYAEAKAKGYIPEELHDADGQVISPEEEKLDSLKVIVTEENICVQTTGKIKYVSDNVSLLDKKLAKAMEAGISHPAFIFYK